VIELVVDLSDLARAVADFTERQAEVEQMVPQVFSDAVLQARSDLRPVWSAPIALQPAEAGQDQSAHFTYVSGVQVKRSSPPRWKKPRGRVVKRRPIQRVSVDEAVGTVEAAVLEKLPEVAAKVGGE